MKARAHMHAAIDQLAEKEIMASITRDNYNPEFADKCFDAMKHLARAIHLFDTGKKSTINTTEYTQHER